MLRTLDAGLLRIEQFVIGILMIAASFILFVNVVARYGFNEGFAWAEELTRYAIVWMVFIGGSLAARNGAHICVDVLSRLLEGQAVRKLLLVGIDLLCVAFSLFVVWIGWELTAQAKEFGQVTPVMQVPLWTMQLAIPVGSALMAMRFFQHALEQLKGGKAESIEQIPG